jgi:hypothetical protein
VVVVSGWSSGRHGVRERVPNPYIVAAISAALEGRPR